ncbi:MAG: four-helix bundle copper-binding protein [Alphaproteobacteria bacterium]
MQNTHIQECIKNCWQCRTECQETLFNHCLKEGGKHVEAEHVKLMMDCIQICQVSADFMTRGSKLHESVCAACADICEACAKSCDAIGGEKMKQCAEACRRCAKTCRDMGNMKKAA